jgi:hypothetical protein
MAIPNCQCATCAPANEAKRLREENERLSRQLEAARRWQNIDTHQVMARNGELEAELMSVRSALRDALAAWTGRATNCGRAIADQDMPRIAELRKLCE